jgi:hypothetical protein
MKRVFVVILWMLCIAIAGGCAGPQLVEPSQPIAEADKPPMIDMEVYAADSGPRR